MKLTANKAEDYPLTPTDKDWFESKLRDYTSLVGKSIDAEADFAAKQKEWMAAVKLGRQSARDRFKAGTILIAIQQKVTDELGYPFWPWLTSMGVPRKTAERAIALTKFYITEDRLSDNTITECYLAMKAAKKTAKATAGNTASSLPVEGKGDHNLGKDTDTVSVPLSTFTTDATSEPRSDDNLIADDDNSDHVNDEKYDQEALLLGLDELEALLSEHVQAMCGDLGEFPDLEAVVTKIDACLALFVQLKHQVSLVE